MLLQKVRNLLFVGDSDYAWLCESDYGSPAATRGSSQSGENLAEVHDRFWLESVCRYTEGGRVFRHRGRNSCGKEQHRLVSPIFFQYHPRVIYFSLSSGKVARQRQWHFFICRSMCSCQQQRFRLRAVRVYKNGIHWIHDASPKIPKHNRSSKLWRFPGPDLTHGHLWNHQQCRAWAAHQSDHIAVAFWTPKEQRTNFRSQDIQWYIYIHIDIHSIEISCDQIYIHACTPTYVQTARPDQTRSDQTRPDILELYKCAVWWWLYLRFAASVRHSLEWGDGPRWAPMGPDGPVPLWTSMDAVFQRLGSNTGVFENGV